jgi:hypothetical protein
MDLYRELIKENDGEPSASTEKAGQKEEKEGNLRIEDEILELERKIANKKGELEKIKKIEGDVEKINTSSQVISHVVSSSNEEMNEEEKDSLREIKNLPRQKQLEVLLEVALKKGVNSSVKIARSLNNAYVLDEFHDALVDRLYGELVEKGQLK